MLSFGNGQHRKTDIIMGRQCLKKHLPPYEKNLIFYKKKKKKRDIEDHLKVMKKSYDGKVVDEKISSNHIIKGN